MFNYHMCYHSVLVVIIRKQKVNLLKAEILLPPAGDCDCAQQ